MHSLNGYNFFYSTCRETLPHSQNGAIALSKQSRASQNLPPLINSSLHVRQKVLDARPHLLAGRPDLVRRQHEAVPARVAQLRRERVLRAHDVVRVVDRAARGLVDGLADGAVLTAKKKKSRQFQHWGKEKRVQFSYNCVPCTASMAATAPALTRWSSELAEGSESHV